MLFIYTNLHKVSNEQKKEDIIVTPDEMLID